MTKIEKAESLLPGLSRQEKMRLLERLVRDLGESFPGIESTPGVAGGEPCIVRTRIPVWILVRARQLGASYVEILRSDPSPRTEAPVHAWTSYELRRDEFEERTEAVERPMFDGRSPMPRGIYA